MIMVFGYVQLPNVLGFLFGIAQMILYLVYKSKQGKELTNQKHNYEPETNNEMKILDIYEHNESNDNNV